MIEYPYCVYPALKKVFCERHMVFDWFAWKRDKRSQYPKVHPTQKPVCVLKRLISVFTDEGDVVIDPCAGSGSTLRAAYEMGRNAYGFEVDKGFYTAATEKMLAPLLEKPKFEQIRMGEMA